MQTSTINTIAKIAAGRWIAADAIGEADVGPRALIHDIISDGLPNHLNIDVQELTDSQIDDIAHAAADKAEEIISAADEAANS